MIRLEAIEDRTPFGIAAEISRHVEAGDLAPGERLPTVREVAARLGVSIGTVSTAWSALSASGVIVSRSISLVSAMMSATLSNVAVTPITSFVFVLRAPIGK